MENIKAKDSVEYKGVTYSVGDVIERLDDCPYPIGSKHTIIRMHHSYEDCVIAVDEYGDEALHALVYVKKVNDFEKHNPELEVGDEVVILEHPVLKRDKGINYPEAMQKEIGSKHEIVGVHEYGYYLSNRWNYEAKYLQKVESYVDNTQLLKREIEVGDLVTLISLENTKKDYGVTGPMKKVGESFIVSYVDDEYVDCGFFSYSKDDVVLLQKDSDMKEVKLAPIDLKLHTHVSFDLAAGEDKSVSVDLDDVVNHPKHYTDSEHGVECIELTRELSFNYGNCLKYVWRQGKKDEVLQEVEKALWYYNDALENEVPLFNGGYPSISFDDNARKVLQHSKGWFYVLINSILIEDIEGIGRALNGIKQETLEMKDIGECCSK